MLLLAGGLVLMTGCGTIGDLRGQQGTALGTGGVHILGGTRGDLFEIGDRAGWFQQLHSYTRFLALVDLPLSFGLDVVLLPLTVPCQIDSPEGKRPAVERSALGAGGHW
jgi:uncharacterized protein YceK